MALVEEIRSWSRRRLAFNVVSLVFALALSALAARHFAEVGWPLAHADPQLAAAAGILFLVAYAFKACGWRRLFVPHERPGSLALAAASGAASIGGAALPGRVDDAIRIAVVRRYPGSRPGVATVCLSLFMLGLIDTVALMPFASTAAVTSEVSIPVRIALAVVAFAGVGAAALVLALPRLVGSRAIARFRAARWLAERAACTREAWKATLLILASWLVRAGGLVLLLGALGVGLSLPLAVAFLTAAAASGALPVAPAGAATQAGAGAGILAASGISTGQAIAFAVAAQALVILAGAVVVLFALAWSGSRRV
ncbi:MAG: flippase-like domain-containing protein, partial [Thermoleophilia bacterium]|nr:flippase-like domain-containing protein [Thermoleophilia bacterium]